MWNILDEDTVVINQEKVKISNVKLNEDDGTLGR